MLSVVEPISKLTEYGIAGVVAAIFLGGLIVIWKRMTVVEDTRTVLSKVVENNTKAQESHVEAIKVNTEKVGGLATSINASIDQQGKFQREIIAPMLEHLTKPRKRDE